MTAESAPTRPGDADDTPTDPREYEPAPGQYSLAKILGIWAAATVPMGLLAFMVVPYLIPRTSLHPGLVHWIAMVVGMMWQFVLSLLVLRAELGGLRWAEVRERIQWQRPRDRGRGAASRMVALWVVVAIVANQAGGWLAGPLDTVWTQVFPLLSERSYTRIEGLIDPQFRGQWWILGLALVSCLFNYVLGEELLFRGVLLPRMEGVFRRGDWVANTVLFGLYHVHKIWFWPSMVASSFGMAWITKRYRSIWLAIIVHGIEGFFVLLVLAIIAGWLP